MASNRYKLGVFLGRLIPWWFMEWACKRFELCWANCVMFKMYGPLDYIGRDRESLKPSWVCFGSDPPYDYCGTYGPEHPCFKRHTANPNGKQIKVEARP